VRRNFRLTAALALTSLLASSCEFQSRRITWRLDTAVTYKVRYSVELRAKAEGSWGASPYVSVAEAGFSLRAVTDTAKAQIEASLMVDTLEYRSAERGPEEDAYMTGRLRKYRAKTSLSRTGQLLAMEEEPGLPPVDFTPLNFGRFLAYAIPSFPDAPLKKGSRWETVQPLLDKFHPESKVVKRFTLSAIRETPEGDLAVCLVEMDVYLTEDLAVPQDGGPGQGGEGPASTGPSSTNPPSAGTASPAPSKTDPALSGRGQMVFNLDKGRPVLTELELEGRFQSRLPQKSGDSAQPETLPLRLQEKVKLAFTE
jgi:hypothetical protein